MFGVGSTFAPIFRIGTKDAVDNMMDRYDMDKNGSLDIDEAQTVPILSRANFEVADSFGDGKLTPKEFVSYVDQMKLEIGQGASINPLAMVMGGGTITIDTFSQIVDQTRSTSGKQQFITYMQHLADEYDAAQKLGATAEDGQKVDTSA